MGYQPQLNWARAVPVSAPWWWRRTKMDVAALTSLFLMNPDLKPWGKRARRRCAGCKNGAWMRRGGSDCETGCSLVNEKSQVTGKSSIKNPGNGIHLFYCLCILQTSILKVLNHHHHMKVLYAPRGSFRHESQTLIILLLAYVYLNFWLRTGKPEIVLLCNFEIFCLHKCKHGKHVTL